MPIDLYWHPLSASSRATAITAQYLGVAVNLKEVDWIAGATREPDFLKINPSHTVPTLVDNGFALFESRAIMTYLANKYAPTSSIYPQDAHARAQVDKILYYDASSYNPALRAIFIPLVEKHEPSGQVLSVLKETIQIFESLLGKQKFFAGETATLADISIGAGSLWVKQLSGFRISLSAAPSRWCKDNCRMSVPTCGPIKWNLGTNAWLNLYHN